MARLKTLTNCLVIDGDPPRVDGPLDLVLDGNRVKARRPAGAQPAEGEVIDAGGLLVTAGLINGHTHSHENYTKGRYENLPLEVWMNYVRPPDPVPFTARQVYLRTMIGIVEALRTGTTTVVDDINITPVLVPAHIEAVLQAYDDSGDAVSFTTPAPLVGALLRHSFSSTFASLPRHRSSTGGQRRNARRADLHHPAPGDRHGMRRR
jgi:cytosine/adenosine deaminase-related metal-dependent hydrolase